MQKLAEIGTKSTEKRIRLRGDIKRLNYLIESTHNEIDVLEAQAAKYKETLAEKQKQFDTIFDNE